MEMKKKFDAVRSVRQIREAHYLQTEGMTKEERLLYYREKGLEARRALERLSKQVPARE